MKKIMMMAAMAAAMVAAAQPLTPGTGVANDHTGQHWGRDRRRVRAAHRGDGLWIR